MLDSFELPVYIISFIKSLRKTLGPFGLSVFYTLVVQNSCISVTSR